MINRMNCLRSRNDRILIAFVIMYFFMQAINLLIKTAFMLDPIWWSYSSKILLGIILCISLCIIAKRNVVLLITMEICPIVLMIITLLTNRITLSEMLDIIFDLCLVYIPLGICAYSVSDGKRLLQGLYNGSFLIHPILIIMMILFKSESGNPYTMSGGYAVLLQLLVVLDHFFYEKRPLDIILVCVDVSMILIRGSRGPLVCLFAFCVFSFFTSEKVKKKTKYILTFVGSMCFVVLFLLKNVLAEWLISMLHSIGLSSRTLTIIISGSGSDSERLRIYNYYWNLIKERPFCGYGLAGRWDVGYPHNIGIELGLAFGVVIGSVCIVFLLVTLCKGITQKNTAWRRLTIIFVSIEVSLLFSGSFLLSFTFYISLLMCMKCRTIHKIRTISSDL